jgi:hypothetical protein
MRALRRLSIRFEPWKLMSPHVSDSRGTEWTRTRMRLLDRKVFRHAVAISRTLNFEKSQRVADRSTVVVIEARCVSHDARLTSCR